MPYNLNMENIIIHNETRDMLPSISSTILHVRYSDYANSKSVQSSPIWRYRVVMIHFDHNTICITIHNLPYGCNMIHLPWLQQLEWDSPWQPGICGNLGSGALHTHDYYYFHGSYLNLCHLKHVSTLRMWNILSFVLKICGLCSTCWYVHCTVLYHFLKVCQVIRIVKSSVTVHHDHDESSPHIRYSIHGIMIYIVSKWHHNSITSHHHSSNITSRPLPRLILYVASFTNFSNFQQLH